MKKIIIISGPTAVGKTKYTIKLAKELNGEIISADSMQLYKYMDIGSAKPTKEELSQVKHHLVDFVDPREPFSVATYMHLAKNAINEVFERGKTPIISGGTGLYINSLIYKMDFSAPPSKDGLRKELEILASEKGNDYIHTMLKELDPLAAERIHPNNTKKIIRAIEVVKTKGEGIRPFEASFEPTEDYSYCLIGLNRNREELYDRINLRVDELVVQGLFDEVKNLLELGLSEDNISMKGIGYKEIIGYFNGEYDREQAIYLVKRNTRHYAKRQLTWLRRYEEMHWFLLSSYNDDKTLINDILATINKCDKQ